MRALKIVGIVVAVLAAVVILGALAVLLLVNPNDYRGDIERLVEQRTGRHLMIRGRLDLKLFPWLAIGVEDLELGNPPGFGSQPFLTVRRASIGVKLLPILAKRLEVSRVAVDGLTANLVSRGKDVNNWKDLTASKSQPSGGGGATQTTVAGVDIHKSALVYRDEVQKSVAELSNLEAHAGRLGGNDPVPATVEFDYGNGKSPPTHIAVAARVQMPKDSSRAELKDVDVHGSLPGDAQKGTRPLPFSLRAPDIALDTHAETLAPATFEAKLGELPVVLTAAGSKIFTDRVVTGKITVPQVSPRKVLQSFGVEPPTTRDPRALSALSLKSDYRLTQKQVSLSGVDLTLDDTHFQGTGAIEDLDTMALGFNLNVNAINADRYLAPQVKGARKEKSQAAPQKPPTPLPIDVLRKLDAHGTLHVGSATLAGVTFTAVSLPLAAKDGRVHIGPTQARLFGGGYNGDIVLDARPAQAELSLNEHIKGVDVGALMKAAADTARLAGRGDANAVVSGTGNTDAALFRSLAGKVDMNVKDGALNGVDLWYELRRARALLKREAIPPRTGPERTPFKTFAGTGTLDKGVMRSDDLRIETDYLKARGRGTLDLGDKAIDYQLVVEVYKLPPAGAGSELADLKAAEIPISITGTLDDMKVRPDIESLAKARVRQEVNQKTEELKKKLGEKLKDLLGH